MKQFSEGGSCGGLGTWLVHEGKESTGGLVNLLPAKVVLTQVEVVLHAVAHDQDTGNGVEQSCFGSVSCEFPSCRHLNLRAGEFLLK